MALKILVIDYEPKWINFLQEELGGDFQVELATDLSTVISKLDNNWIDIIVANSQCYVILTEIRSVYPDVPIIVATGQPSPREAIRMFRLDVLDYFSKDFRSQEISSRIKSATQVSIMQNFEPILATS